MVKKIQDAYCMNKKRHPKQIFEGGPCGERERSRPKLPWMKDKEADLRSLGVRNWWRAAEDWAEWRNIVEETKGLPAWTIAPEEKKKTNPCIEYFLS